MRDPVALVNPVQHRKSGGRRIVLTVPEAPPAKNRRFRIGQDADGRGIMFPSASALAWVGHLALVWRMSREPPIRSGTWAIGVHTTWTRERHMADGLSFALGDCDATISSVMDGLQKCGALDDDVRIERVTLTKAYGPAPMVVIELTELAADGDEQIGLLP